MERCRSGLSPDSQSKHPDAGSVGPHATTHSHAKPVTMVPKTATSRISEVGNRRAQRPARKAPETSKKLIGLRTPTPPASSDFILHGRQPASRAPHAPDAACARITNAHLERQLTPMHEPIHIQHITLTPSHPCPTQSPHASSASAPPQPTSAWTRTASTAKCVHASPSFQSAHKASPSTALTSTPGPTSINVETGVPRLTGASHGTKQ